MTTLKDIARECGVSVNTVSSVLNNKPGEVSAATRARVLQVMRRLEYRPSAAARQLVGKSTRTLGIADKYLYPQIMDPYKDQTLGPLIHTARAARWDVLYYSGYLGEEPEKKTGKEGGAGDSDSRFLVGGYPGFLDGRCDGLICFTGNVPVPEVDAILRANLPVVFIGEALEDRRGGAFIDVDNQAGAYLGVSHLLGLGHSRIAMLDGHGTSGSAQRVAGYMQALADAGLPPRAAQVLPAVAWDQAGYAAAAAALDAPAGERPTALFCFNDVQAFGVLQAISALGLRCPKDVSVVGFDDIAAAQTASTPLTTVQQPLARIGRRAVEILLALLDGSLPRDYTEIVPPALIVRASTAPPPPEAAVREQGTYFAA